MLGRGGAAREVGEGRQPPSVPAGEKPQWGGFKRARERLSTVVFVAMSAPLTDVKSRVFERLAQTSPYSIAVGFDSLQSNASIQHLRSFVRKQLGQKALFVPMSAQALRTRHTERIDNFAGGRGQSSGAELAALDWFAGSRFAWMWHLEDNTWSADFGTAASRYAHYKADLIIHSGQRLPAWATAGDWKVGSDAHIRPCGPGLLCYASLAAYRASQRFARALLDEIRQGAASSTNTSHHSLYLPFVISQHPELIWQPLRPVHLRSISAPLKHSPPLCAVQRAELYHPVLSLCGSAVEGYALTNKQCKECPHPARSTRQSSLRLWERSDERAAREAGPWCLLLSATTNVKVDLRRSGYGRFQQRNVSERQQMYSQVLAHWVGAYPKLLVALAENSGDSLAWTSTDATKGARLERLRIGPASTCPGEEIGCHEADAILRAVRTSRFFRARGPHEQRLCTHALKVTGRYAVTSDVDAALRGCARGWDVALQNTTWGGTIDGKPTKGMHGTQVLGFRVALAEDLFGWSQFGEMCQECHVHAWLQHHPAARVCHLPPLSVKSVRGGSNGVLVSSL